jgi:hypothetical protein
MKFAVIPIMEMRQMACMARTTVKDAPRAPNCGAGILTGWDCFLGFGFGSGRGDLGRGSSLGLIEENFVRGGETRGAGCAGWR